MKSKFKVGDIVKSKYEVFSDSMYDKTGAFNLGRETFTANKVEYWEQGKGYIVYGEKSDKRDCKVWHHEDDLDLVINNENKQQ